jgi:hypothetical protein
MFLKNPTNGKTMGGGGGEVKVLQENGIRGTKYKQNMVKNIKNRRLCIVDV